MAVTDLETYRTTKQRLLPSGSLHTIAGRQATNPEVIEYIISQYSEQWEKMRQGKRTESVDGVAMFDKVMRKSLSEELRKRPKGAREGGVPSPTAFQAETATRSEAEITSY